MATSKGSRMLSTYAQERVTTNLSGSARKQHFLASIRHVEVRNFTAVCYTTTTNNVRRIMWRIVARWRIYPATRRLAWQRQQLVADFTFGGREARLYCVIKEAVVSSTRQTEPNVLLFTVCQFLKMIESFLTSLGAKVVVVSSCDENHPPENIIDGWALAIFNVNLLCFNYLYLKALLIIIDCLRCWLSSDQFKLSYQFADHSSRHTKTFWMSTGMFPQEFIIRFEQPTNISAATVDSYNGV